MSTAVSFAVARRAVRRSTEACSALIRASVSCTCDVTSVAEIETCSTLPRALSFSRVDVSCAAGMRRVNDALPLSPCTGAVSSRASTRPPAASTIAAALRAASAGASTVTVTVPVVMMERSTWAAESTVPVPDAGSAATLGATPPDFWPPAAVS